MGLTVALIDDPGATAPSGGAVRTAGAGEGGILVLVLA